MARPSILQLQDELITRLKSTTTFRRNSFPVYDLRDLQTHREGGVAYPMVGVAYEGGNIETQEVSTNANARHTASKNLFRIRFSVMMAMEYSGAGGNNTRDEALGLLQESRDAILGFKGVNSRPWTLISEQPLDGELDGVIFYGQLWVTDVITVGTHTEN